MDRRAFLKRALVAGGGAAALPSTAMVAGAGAQGADAAGPYGSIDGLEPDENGLLLPEGFTSRVVGVAGEPVGDTDYAWHVFPDGAATFDDGEGGWWLVSNSEVLVPAGNGGASSIHFDGEGEVVEALRILDGTTGNCAGGPTPWGTWLSCEESGETGQVWEAWPDGSEEAVAHPAMGRWNHEAVAVDPDRERLYLTQDTADGVLYRFTPAAYPDLDAGVLEAAQVSDGGQVRWIEVGDPSGESAPTQAQVPEATVFPGNEGIWYHDGTIVFTSKGDGRVHAIDVTDDAYELVYEPPGVLGGVDNITVEAGSGDLFVAEDGDNMEVVLVTPEGAVVPFARVVEPGHEQSEVTGPVFNPAGDRLYFSSQRGPTPKTLVEIAGVGGETNNGGLTYEVTGPFRGVEASQDAASPSTTLAGAGSGDGGGDGGTDALPWVAAGGVVAAGVVGGAVWLRSRRAPG